MEVSIEAVMDVNGDDDNTKGVAKPGKHSLISAIFVQIHTAIV